MGNNNTEDKRMKKEETKNQGGEQNKYEYVDHPTHYNNSSVETIDKMVRIWGPEKTALWCEMTAFKYRDRIGSKPGEDVEREIGKIKWYENKRNELLKLF